MVGVWVGGETAIGEGQTAWQLWGLACRIIFSTSTAIYLFNFKLFMMDSVSFSDQWFSDSVAGLIFSLVRADILQLDGGVRGRGNFTRGNFTEGNFTVGQEPPGAV